MPSVASLPGDSAPYLAWSPSPNAPPTICTTTVSVTLDNQAGDYPLFCSQDGGKTWVTRPTINAMETGDAAPQGVGMVFAITSDGSLLAVFYGQTVITFYRLGPHDSQWQSLGDEPEQRPAFGRSPLLPGAVVCAGVSSSPLLLSIA